MTDYTSGPTRGLVLQPFRALRPSVDGPALARQLCPPYDVIDAARRAALIEAEPDNAVAVILPDEAAGGDRYTDAAQRLDGWVRDGRYAVDHEPALYVYEMRDGVSATRGLVGALELRDPADGVILPHENTMAGPVADRLALMSATRANVEAIYLVYDGGGPASEAVASVDDVEPLVSATTDDGIAHRLWAITDPAVHRTVGDDLATRRALIADGHHRYATYRELQQNLRGAQGAGPWDFGLTLLVDSSSYGPQVHAIHRVVRLPLDRALAGLAAWGVDMTDVSSPEQALADIDGRPGFVAVLSDGTRTVVIADAAGRVREASTHEGETATLTDLDVTVLHRGLVERVWEQPDTVEAVGYAHSIDEALAAARAQQGTAVLLRPTPVPAVAAVAAAGARMPRKSTLFTPKPASGLVMRRFADAGPAAPN
ncbi:MAG: DUF1015 domain-containing protein [Jatrophihabitantaceae bacterium]